MASIKDIITAAQEDNATGLRKSFDSIMAEKMQDAIADRRSSVVNDVMFGEEDEKDDDEEKKASSDDDNDDEDEKESSDNDDDNDDDEEE